LEIATAVAGSIIGINAFNQPDVEASKIATRQLTSEYEKTGALPETPILYRQWHPVVYRRKNAAVLAEAVGAIAHWLLHLRAHLDHLKTVITLPCCMSR